MTDRENFLERWSRRKRETTEPADAPQAPNSTGEAAPSSPSASPDPGDDSKTKPAQTPVPTPDPAFDLASLPPIESITAATDVRAFLAPGVPLELMNAALRRAWAADPAIRDFVGLAENAWDFTDPSAVPGFGDLPPGYDLHKLVAEVFGQPDRTGEPTAASVPSQTKQIDQMPAAVSPTAPNALAQSCDEPDQTDPGAGQAAQPAQLESEFVQDSKNVASQSKIIAPQDENPTRRKHGGALPQ